MSDSLVLPPAAGATPRPLADRVAPIGVVWQPTWFAAPLDATGRRTASEQRLAMALTPSDRGERSDRLGVDRSLGEDTFSRQRQRHVSLEEDVPRLLSTSAGRWHLLTWWLERRKSALRVRAERCGGGRPGAREAEIDGVGSDFLSLLVGARMHTADVPGREERERAPLQFAETAATWDADEWDKVIPRPLWHRILEAELAEAEAQGVAWTPLLDRLAALRDAGILAWTPSGMAAIRGYATSLRRWLGTEGDVFDSGRLADRSEEESLAIRVETALGSLADLRVTDRIWSVIRSTPSFAAALEAAIQRAANVPTPEQWLAPVASQVATWSKREVSELVRETSSAVFHRTLLAEREPAQVSTELSLWVAQSAGSAGLFDGLVDGPLRRDPALWETTIEMVLDGSTWQGGPGFLERRMKAGWVFPEPLVQALRVPSTPVVRRTVGSYTRESRIAYWRAANADATASDWEPLMHAVSRGDMTAPGLALLLTHPGAHGAAIELVRDALNGRDRTRASATRPTSAEEQPGGASQALPAPPAADPGRVFLLGGGGLMQPLMATQLQPRVVSIREEPAGAGGRDRGTSVPPEEAAAAAFSTHPAVVATRRQWIRSQWETVAGWLLAEPEIPAAVQVLLAETVIKPGKGVEVFVGHRPARDPEAVMVAIRKRKRDLQGLLFTVLHGPDAWLEYPPLRAWVKQQRQAMQQGQVLQRLLETARGAEVGELIGQMAQDMPAFVLAAFAHRNIPDDAIITPAQVRPFAQAASRDPRARERWITLLRQSAALSAALGRAQDGGALPASDSAGEEPQGAGASVAAEIPRPAGGLARRGMGR